MRNLMDNKTLMISSLTPEGKPFVSYAPFVEKDNKIYIYISRAAEHYYNILNQPKVSVMIIEDENKAKNPFLRERVSFKCHGTRLAEIEEEVWKAFEEKQASDILQVLAQMDFEMFELKTEKGRLVKGFGQAYDIQLEGNEWELIQVKGMGHRSK